MWSNRPDDIHKNDGFFVSERSEEPPRSKFKPLGGSAVVCEAAGVRAATMKAQPIATPIGIAWICNDTMLGRTQFCKPDSVQHYTMTAKLLVLE